MEADYLILGSGLSALSFGALASKSGAKVVILEAHDIAGGFGHTFTEKNGKDEYHFNAQLHYVWECGEGESVNLILKKLDLDKTVQFIKYNEDGFDHMQLPHYKLKIPNDYELLTQRLTELFPNHKKSIINFLTEIKDVALLVKNMAYPLYPITSNVLKKTINIKNVKLLKYYNLTLQNVFDKFQLPLEAQSLLASQWPDFLLPPNELAFYCWLTLFDGYMNGAYYPQKHFEHVINSLVQTILDNNGEIIYNTKVEQFNLEKNKIKSVIARDTSNHQKLTEYTGKNIICNFDPKHAANMIGLENFSPAVKKQLEYDYSHSNFVVYGAVRDIDLKEYGFGNWNMFHSEQNDINKVFNEMLLQCDYSNPSFVITTPSLVTDDPTGCPEGQQIFQLLTVANYSLFSHLKLRSTKDYVQLKNDICKKMFDVIEKKYIPNFKKHVSIKIIGSPTTNASYCLAPNGNSYGANMTPKNMGMGKLGFHTSIDNFYFCNASSGFAGFTKSLSNGARLYEMLLNTKVLGDHKSKELTSFSGINSMVSKLVDVVK